MDNLTDQWMIALVGGSVAGVISTVVGGIILQIILSPRRENNVTDHPRAKRESPPNNSSWVTNARTTIFNRLIPLIAVGIIIDVITTILLLLMFRLNLDSSLAGGVAIASGLGIVAVSFITHRISLSLKRREIEAVLDSQSKRNGSVWRIGLFWVNAYIIEKPTKDTIYSFLGQGFVLRYRCFNVHYESDVTPSLRILQKFRFKGWEVSSSEEYVSISKEWSNAEAKAIANEIIEANSILGISFSRIHMSKRN